MEIKDLAAQYVKEFGVGVSVDEGWAATAFTECYTGGADYDHFLAALELRVSAEQFVKRAEAFDPPRIVIER